MVRFLHVSPAAIAALFASIAHASDWPGFRGANLSGTADGSAPTTWDATKNVNIAWKTAIPGLGLSSPIVSGDRVFVTTAISSDPKPFRHGLFGDPSSSNDVASHTWKIYCLDRESGKILWERTAHEGPPRVKRHPKSSQATATPVTDGKHVVAMFGSEGLYAYDFSGKLLWKQDLGVLSTGSPMGDADWAPGSSPIIHKNLVIVQCDNRKDAFIAAFDLDTGKQVWRTPRQEPSSWATPLIFRANGRDELITNGQRATRAYDPSTGKELWSMRARNLDVAAPSPVVGRDLIIVGNGFQAAPLTAIKAGAHGEFTLKDNDETNEHVAWSKSRGGPQMSTSLVVGDSLYVVSQTGVVSNYQVATGEQIYQQRLAAGQGTAVSSSPVYADGKLYLAGEDGDVFVIKAGPKFELLSTNPMGESLMAVPAIADGTIFVRGEHSVFAIREKK